MCQREHQGYYKVSQASLRGNVSANNLAVRLAVQFQSVLDNFPHDAVFSFTTATELSESALGLCTMSLPAVSLTSSSSSLRRRRLNEITEDAEETTPAHSAVKSTPLKSITRPSEEKLINDDLPASAQKAKALLARIKEAKEAGNQGRLASERMTRHQPSSDVDKKVDILPTPREESLSPVNANSHGRDQSPETVTTATKIGPVTPEASVPYASSRLDGEHMSTVNQSSTSISRDTYTPIKEQPSAFQPSPHLSPAESNSISRWTDDVIAAQYPLPKIKRKFGPRPHLESYTRPRTSGNSDENIPNRRVANLPASVRISARPMTSGQLRPGSQQSSRSVPSRFAASNNLPPPLPSPTRSVMPQQQPRYRPSPSVASSITESGAPPEKLRLMKALQMRKRNQMTNPRALGNSISTNGDFPSTSSDQYMDRASVAASHVANNSRSVRTPEMKHPGDSNSATPTSVATMSEDISTKPSSFSDSANGRPSNGSISSDTNSSTTPKAEEGRVLNKKHVKSSLHDMEEEDTEKATSPVMSPVDEALMKLTGGADLPPPVVEPVIQETPLIKSPELRIEDTSISQNLVPPRGKPLAPAVSTRRKRRTDIGGTSPRPGNADISDLSDDDEFLDELQNATFEEAKPVSVARTPATPVLAKHSFDRLREMGRVVSPGNIHQSNQERSSSRADSSRSVSTALPQWQTYGPEPFQPKQKLTIGSSISKRIKALEGRSNRESLASPSRESPQRVSTFSPTARRGSQMQDPPTLKYSSADSNDMQASRRPSFQRQSVQAGEQHSPHKRGSVSVTARIIRSSRHLVDEFNESSFSLHRSPLIVEREGRQTTDSHSLAQPPQSPTSSRRRPSISSHQSNPHANLPPPTDTMATRLSFAGSLKKLSRMSADVPENPEDKKGSRTSRMLKRFSGMGNKRSSRQDFYPSPGKDSRQQDVFDERAEPEYRNASIDTTALNVVDIGDVNVQFPETLLWKRRFLRIDDQGFLIFAPPSNDTTMRARSRKFHLADFKAPVLPDQEREEMAWSILMDLQDGGCIQCACENKQAQQAVLKMLLDAHSAYQQLYG